MDNQLRSPRKVLRTVVAICAMTTALAATTGTSAHADYPPLPPTGETASDVVVAAPVPFAPSAPAQGDLPSTGSSGVSTTMVAGGLALLLGVTLTSWSVVSDRRRSSAHDPVA